MEAENKSKDNFDTVKIFREIKSKISNDIKDKNYAELMVYFEKTKLKGRSEKGLFNSLNLT